MTCAIVSRPTTSAVRKVPELGAAELLAGEVVDDVVRQAELLGLLDRRQHAEDADAVGDEVRRVLRAHHALAERAGEEGFELVEDLGLRGRRRDQLHQVHVARRVEEMDAAKARLDLARQPSDSLVIDRPEVLDATMACGAMCGATFLYRSSFQSMRSAIASMIRSQSRSRSRCSS